MELAAALAYPACRRVLLAELELPVAVVLWAQHGTYPAVWHAAVAGEVIGAREDGEALAAAASLAACATADGSWWWDSAAGVLYVNPGAADPRGASLQAVVIHAFATHPRGGAGYLRPYAARLLRAPDLSTAVDPDWAEAPEVGGGRLELAAGDGGVDDLIDADLGAATARLYLGGDVLY